MPSVPIDLYLELESEVDRLMLLDVWADACPMFPPRTTTAVDVDVGQPGPTACVRPPGSLVSAGTGERPASPAWPTLVDVEGRHRLGMPMVVDVARQPSLAPPAFVDVASGLGRPQPGLGPPAFVDDESRQGIGTPMPVDVSCPQREAVPVED